VITSAAPTAVPNLVQIRPWGLLGKWVKYNENFIYLYLFRELTYTVYVKPVDGFSCLIAQTTRGLVDVTPHFGVKSPPPKKKP